MGIIKAKSLIYRKKLTKTVDKSHKLVYSGGNQTEKIGKKHEK